MGLTKQVFVGTLAGMASGELKKARKPPQHPEFGRVLMAGMRKSGVTAAAIVSELRVDPETVRLWKRGERMPRDAKLRRLAKMIGVDVAALRYPDSKATAKPMPTLEGLHITDEDEVRLIEAYRGLDKEWAKQALRNRAVELLEEFGKKGVENPWAKSGTH